jgi:hypothetical protein
VPKTYEEVVLARETALRLIEAGAVPNQTQAAEMVGQPESTLRRWMRESPEFKRRWDNALKAAKARQVDRWESAMSERALDVKNPAGVTAGIFLLKSHRRALYGDRFTGMGPAGITVNIDKAQINLEREASQEMRELEGE